MVVKIGGVNYIPGTYGKKRPNPADVVDQYLHEWDEKRVEEQAEAPPRELPPSVCFSRKIGVGALETADILAEQIGYRVVDREVMEYMANVTPLRDKMIAFFGSRYPDKLEKILPQAIGRKASVENAYTKHLATAVVCLAGLGSTIFVGRGMHLWLPRDRVLVVRFIGKRKHRANRLARILNLSEEEAESALYRLDSEQRVFFETIHVKRNASPYEFDMVINCDYIHKPKWAAQIVTQAFNEKFGVETESR
jgi:cytidylate kinase